MHCKKTKKELIVGNNRGILTSKHDNNVTDMHVDEFSRIKPKYEYAKKKK